MIALLRKELQGLKAFAALLLGIILIAWIYTCATKYPDNTPLHVQEAIDADHQIPIMIFALMLGAGLLVRESDDRTLSFLDGLPLSRTRIFWAKCLAGFLILSLFPILDFGQDVLFGVLSQTSVSPPFPWEFVLWFGALCLLTAAYTLSMSVALSFLRGWFALVLGLLVFCFLWAESHGLHWVELLNPKSLHPHMVNGRVQIPLRILGAQAAVSVAALGIAWLLFHFMGVKSLDPLDRSGRIARWVRSLAKLCTPVIWVVVVIFLAKSASPDSEAKPGVAGESAFAKRDTARYEFLFRESQREKAKPLFPGADAVYNQVAHFFGASGESERVVVDLASPVTSHAGGMTNWTKVRLPLIGDQPLHELNVILGHETAHVLMHEIGGPFFFSDYESTRFFNEGMATVVEHKFFSSEAEVKAAHRLAAAVAARGKVPFATLCSNTQLSASRDPELVYPLGSAFCRALIHTCGDDAPGKVVAEFKHRRYGDRAAGETLWRDILQSCGYSLDRVVAAYDAELQRLLNEESEFLATIPRLLGTVRTEDSQIIIQPHFDGKAPGQIVCCVLGESVGGDGRTWHKPGKDGTIRFPRSEVAASSVHYMLGWHVPGLPWPVFEPWADGTLDEK